MANQYHKVVAGICHMQSLFVWSTVKKDCLLIQRVHRRCTWYGARVEGVIRGYVAHALETFFFAHSANWSMMVGQAAVMT